MFILVFVPYQCQCKHKIQLKCKAFIVIGLAKSAFLDSGSQFKTIWISLMHLLHLFHIVSSVPIPFYMVGIRAYKTNGIIELFAFTYHDYCVEYSMRVMLLAKIICYDICFVKKQNNWLEVTEYGRMGFPLLEYWNGMIIHTEIKGNNNSFGKTHLFLANCKTGRLNVSHIKFLLFWIKTPRNFMKTYFFFCW